MQSVSDGYISEMPAPPYFSRLLHRLDHDDAQIRAAFGKHVHWGYFADPGHAPVTADDYGRAAEALCLKMIEMAGVSDGLQILDVGCGFGGTLSCINAMASHVELTGVNIDPRQLQQATRLVQPRPENIVHFIAADAGQLAIADATVDVALSVESVFHFDRPRFLAEISRVLRRGGNLTISDFVPDESAQEFIEGIHVTADEAVRSAYGSIDISWSIERYEEVASSCNLSLTQVVDISSHTLPTYGFLHQCVQSWKDKVEARDFQRATNLLEWATRRGYIAYQLMRFEKNAP